MPRVPKALKIVLAVAAFGVLSGWLVPNGGSDRLAARNAVALANLHAISLAITASMLDDRTYPPMQNTAALQTALCPKYLRDARILANGGAHVPFRTNPRVSHLDPRRLRLVPRLGLLYEQRPSRSRSWHLGFGRAVLFSDGRTAWISEDKWPEIDPGRRTGPAPK